MYEEKLDNSMDFVYGEEYQVFVSYFLTNPGFKAVSSAHVWGGEGDGTKEPIFK